MAHRPSATCGTAMAEDRPAVNVVPCKEEEGLETKKGENHMLQRMQPMHVHLRQPREDPQRAQNSSNVPAVASAEGRVLTSAGTSMQGKPWVVGYGDTSRTTTVQIHTPRGAPRPARVDGGARSRKSTSIQAIVGRPPAELSGSSATEPQPHLSSR